MVGARTKIVAILMTLSVAGSAFGQAAAPVSPPQPTLWSFLGIPQGVNKVRGALTNRRGNRPRREPKPALKALNAPENLESENLAIKRAAEIKQAEDLKPQKIKAIKYLTSIGCGCYDKDGSVSDAIVAAAEDCTEDVRLATMNEITEAANGQCCSNCGQVCCCNEKVLKKLAQIAYERDEFGCYSEPSARVRASAAEALAACCKGSPPLEILEEDVDETLPEPEELEPVPEKSDQDDDSPVPEGDDALSDEDLGPVTIQLSDRARLRRVSSRSAARPPVRSSSRLRPGSIEIPSAVPSGIAAMRQLMAYSDVLSTALPNPGGGVVMAIDQQQLIAYIHFEDPSRLVPSGTRLQLHSAPRSSRQSGGVWQVIESSQGCANLTPVTREDVYRVQVGDHADFESPDVVVTSYWKK